MIPARTGTIVKSPFEIDLKDKAQRANTTNTERTVLLSWSANSMFENFRETIGDPDIVTLVPSGRISRLSRTRA